MNKFDAKLKKHIADNFAEYKGDLFSVFMYHNFSFCTPDGYSAFMTPNVWMFIKSYEALRKYIINYKGISSLIQMAKGAFFKEATVDICAFVLHNSYNDLGDFIRLEDFKGDMEVQKQKVLEALADKSCGYYYETDQTNFSKIPGSPIAYWVSENLLASFTNGNRLGNIADSKQGIATADNNKYLRLWYEVSVENVKFDAKTHEEASLCSEKWYPYNKGGEFRKWYGNNDFVVNWYRDGKDLRNDRKAVLRNRPFYFKPCFSWSLVTSSVAAFRYKPMGHIFDVAGMSCFSQTNLLYLLALCNTKVVMKILEIIAPTINYQCGDIANIPVIVTAKESKQNIEKRVESCINISRKDWDSFETSWDFKRNPLV